MKTGLVRLVSLLSLFFFLGPHPSFAADPNASGQVAVQLLGYISANYSEAVTDGRVVDPREFQELLDFYQTIRKSVAEIPALQSDVFVNADLAQLSVKLESKAPLTELRSLCTRLTQAVVDKVGLKVAPSVYPNMNHGQSLFVAQCALCHGAEGRGDGVGARGLEPPPTNFHTSKMADLSPYQAFNTIRLGVPGTAMRAFSELSEVDAWALAFWVVGLRHVAPTERASTLPAGLNLEGVARSTDQELGARFGASSVAGIRHAKPKVQSPLGIAMESLGRGEKLVEQGQAPAAMAAVIAGYLNGVELAEPTLRATSPSIASELETSFLDLRGLLDTKPIPADWRNAFDRARLAIQAAENQAGTQTHSWWFVFSMSSGIFFREALESLVILVLLLSVARSAGAKSAVQAIHVGWMSAGIVGIVAWIFSGAVANWDGIGREAMEGAIATFAVVVLLYAGFWMHRNSEMGKWTRFVKNSVRGAMESRRLFGLAAISFFAVFREVVETVLFLRAVLLQAPTMGSAVGAGVLLTFALTIVLAVLWLRYSLRLQMAKLFRISTAITLLLAFVLIGKGIHSFQEAGWVSLTRFPFALHAELLGIFPSWETLLAQLGILVLIGGYRVSERLSSRR